MTTTEELKQAWKEIKQNLKDRNKYPLAFADNHPSEQAVRTVDEFITSLDSVARIDDIKSLLP